MAIERAVWHYSRAADRSDFFREGFEKAPSAIVCKFAKIIVEAKTSIGAR